MMASGLGIALLFVGMKLKRKPSKSFSRSFSTDALLVSDHFDREVTEAADRKKNSQ
jgi:hypothetical protein